MVFFAVVLTFFTIFVVDFLFTFFFVFLTSVGTVVGLYSSSYYFCSVLTFYEYYLLLWRYFL